MSVTNSKTGIVNLALDIIKTETINDVEVPDGNKIAEVAERWYDDVRQNALGGFPWNFATTRKSIPLNAAAPTFGFDDAYKLPNNYLSLNARTLFFELFSLYDKEDSYHHDIGSNRYYEINAHMPK